MKKILLSLIVICLFAAFMVVPASAAEHTSQSITQRLSEIYENPNWNYSGQCYGFAKNTFRQVFGVTVNWSYNGGETDSENLFNVYTAYELNEIPTLFSLAQPGDVMAWNGTNGSPPHSSVIYENEGDLLRVIDANSDGTNTVRIHDWYTLAYVENRMAIGGTTCVALFRYTPSSLSLSESDVTLRVGNSFPLSISADPVDYLTPTWVSSNPQIAEVDGSGNVTALRAGQVTISCIVGDKTASCVFTVQDNFSMQPTLEIKASSLYNANAYTIPVLMNGSVQYLGEIEWSSSDESIVIIDPDDGQLIGKKSGQAFVIARISRGGVDYTLRCKVTVS